MSHLENTTILAKILLAIFLLGWMIMYIVIGHEFFKSIGVGKTSTMVINRGGYKTIASSSQEPVKNCSNQPTMIRRTENGSASAKPSTITNLDGVTTEFVHYGNGTEENVTTSTPMNEAVINPTTLPGTTANLDVTTEYLLSGNRTEQHNKLERRPERPNFFDGLDKPMVLDPIYVFWRIFQIIAEDLRKNKELARRTKKPVSGKKGI